VESSDVCDILAHEGCDEAQGFYYSKAVSIDELLNVVRSIEGQPES
jgi:EAL domain-containing protein (putative c-di-GMP-specific phosphodiesterase class I)